MRQPRTTVCQTPIVRRMRSGNVSEIKYLVRVKAFSGEGQPSREEMKAVGEQLARCWDDRVRVALTIPGRRWL